MRNDVNARIHKEFKKTLDEMYPDIKNITEKTNRLNQRLMELVREKKK